MSESPGGFRHEPLDLSKQAIRVFQILPSEDGPHRTVACQLFHISEPKSHIAVSYVWGFYLSSHTIYINDKPFKVSLNLFRLLLRLSRLENFTAYYWIDAICIDQSNVSERNHQVQQMGTIYRNADQVICWLGSGFTRYVDVVSDILESTNFRHDCAGATKPLDPFTSVVARLECQVSHSRQVDSLKTDVLFLEARHNSRDSWMIGRHPFWEGLRELCETGYWKRAWIIQEFLLNEKCRLLYGNNSTNARTFSKFLQSCIQYQLRYVLTRNSGDEHIQDWPATRLALRHGDEGIRSGHGELSDLLRSAGDAQCSDQRDRIYSLLSLCSIALSVDYSEPAPTLLVRTWAASEKLSLDSLLRLKSVLRVPYDQISQDLKLRRIESMSSYQSLYCRLPLPLVVQAPQPFGLDYHYGSDNDVWHCFSAIATKSLRFCQCVICSTPLMRPLYPSVVYVKGIWANGAAVAFVSYRQTKDSGYSIGLGFPGLNRARPMHVLTPDFLRHGNLLRDKPGRARGLFGEDSECLKEAEWHTRSKISINTLGEAEALLEIKAVSQIGDLLMLQNIPSENENFWEDTESLLQRHLGGHDEYMKASNEDAQRLLTQGKLRRHNSVSISLHYDDDEIPMGLAAWSV